MRGDLVNLKNFSEIKKEDEPALQKYWSYLESKRASVDDSLLGAADIAIIFPAVEELSE
jgi:hypothetical protein